MFRIENQLVGKCCECKYTEYFYFIMIYLLPRQVFFVAKDTIVFFGFYIISIKNG